MFPPSLRISFTQNKSLFYPATFGLAYWLHDLHHLTPRRQLTGDCRIPGRNSAGPLPAPARLFRLRREQDLAVAALAHGMRHRFARPLNVRSDILSLLQVDIDPGVRTGVLALDHRRPADEPVVFTPATPPLEVALAQFAALRREGLVLIAPSPTDRRASIVRRDFLRLVRSDQIDADACGGSDADPVECDSTFHTLSASVGALRKGRRYAIVAIAAFSSLVTPPDVISQIGLGVPIIVLYELSIIAVRMVERRRAQAEAAEEAAGRAAAIVVEEYQAIPFVAENEGTSILNPDAPFSQEYGAWALPRGDVMWQNYINGWLSYYISNGTLDNLYTEIIGPTEGLPPCS